MIERLTQQMKRGMSKVQSRLGVIEEALRNAKLSGSSHDVGALAKELNTLTLGKFSGWEANTVENYVYTKPRNTLDMIPYIDFWDYASNKSGIWNIDFEPILFEANGRHFKIELWKGIYIKCATGAEVGLYHDGLALPENRDKLEEVRDWLNNTLGKRLGSESGAPVLCATDYSLKMKYSLIDAATKLSIMTRDDDTWYLSGFKPWFTLPAMLSKSQLKLWVYIDFRDANMRNAFSLAASKCPRIVGLGNSGATRVTFTWLGSCKQ
jgi:hypothetical protein